MKQKSHALILLSWIHDFLLFEGIYLLYFAVTHAGKSIAALLEGLSMLVPVILSYLMIRRCRNLWLFLIFSLAATWGMTIISQNKLTGILTAFVCLFRCYVKLKEAEIRRKMRELPGAAGISEDKETWEIPTLLDAPKIPYCLIFVVMYLVIVYIRRYELLPFMLRILAAEFCVCLAYYYLEQLDRFMKDNLHVANLPASAMKKIGTGIVLIGITLLILFMLPAAIYHKEPLSKLRFAPANTGNTVVEQYEESSEPDPMMLELMQLKAHAKKTPEWLKKASEIVSALTVLGIVIAVLKIILKAIQKAMVSFSEDAEDEIIFLDQESDVKEGRKRLFNRSEREKFRSPDRKIRRLYKKLIRRNLPDRPYGNETPLELENKAALYKKGREETIRLHELYEKARYGKDQCTKEDVKQYTDILSGLGR